MSASVPLSGYDTDLVSALGDLFGRIPEPVWMNGDIRAEVWDTAILDPAREILSRSGKGVRPRVLERCWSLAGGDPAGPPELLPIVIELLHVGSLIVDDIEDDSRQRRGRPALHRQYGLPLALNTGNWLYFVGLAVLSRIDLADRIRLALYEDISVALMQCHQGQALDLSTRIASTRRSDVPGLVETSTRLKTGTLMQLAAKLGARGAGASGTIVGVCGSYGAELGIALQMLDDWSGIGIEARREKGREDLRLSRPTWPWVWLAEGADEVAYHEVVRQARDIRIDWDADQLVDRLRALLGSVAPGRIRAQLEIAVDRLESGLPADADLGLVRADVAALEQAFG